MFYCSHGSPRERLGLTTVNHHETNLVISETMEFTNFVRAYECANIQQAVRLLRMIPNKIMSDTEGYFWDFLVLVALDIRQGQTEVLNVHTVNYFSRDEESWPYEPSQVLQQEARDVIAENMSVVIKQMALKNQLLCQFLIDFWATSLLHCRVTRGKEQALSFLKAPSRPSDLSWANYQSACVYMGHLSVLDIWSTETYRLLCDLLYQELHNCQGEPHFPLYHNPPMDLGKAAEIAKQAHTKNALAADLMRTLIRQWRKQPVFINSGGKSDYKLDNFRKMAITT